jgi:hypothetical protein
MKPTSLLPPERFPREAHFLVVSALILAALLWPFIPVDLSDPLESDHVVGLELRTLEETSPTLKLMGAWDLRGPRFVPLEPGSSLQYDLPEGPWTRVETRLIGPPGQLWSVRLSRGFQGRLQLRVPAGEVVRFERDELPGDPGDERSMRLTISPVEPIALGAALGRVNVRASTFASSDRPVSLAGLFLAPLIPFALCAFLCFPGRRPLAQGVVIAGALSIVLAVACRQKPEFLEHAPAVLAGLFLAGAGGALTRLWRGDAALPPETARWLAEVLAVAAIMAMAASLRWDALVADRGTPLSPDAAGYLQIAREGTFYKTVQDHAPWVREPLFPALLRIWQDVAPVSSNAARVLTILISLGSVVACWLVGRAIFGSLAALLAAGWMAGTPYLSWLSVQVLRDDLIGLLVLGLMAVPLYLGGDRWWRAAAFGIVGALLALTRVNFLLIVPLLLLIEAVRRRWHPAEALLTLVLLVLPVLPHLTFNARVGDGDHLYSSTVHVRYYANRDHLGEAGFPATFAEWNRDPYAGGVMHTGEFLRLYSPLELVWRTVRGYVMIFAYEYPHAQLFRGNEWVMLLGLVGLVGWWRVRREYWWVAGWFVVIMGPVAMVATITLDYRLAVPATAVILWTWGAGAAIGVEQLRRLWSERGAPKDEG